MILDDLPQLLSLAWFEVEGLAQNIVHEEAMARMDQWIAERKAKKTLS